MSEIKINTQEQIGNAIINKFVNEEIMTKSELDSKLDAVMAKYTLHMDAKFDLIDSKFNSMDTRISSIENEMRSNFHKVDTRYNWIIGVTLSVGVAISGLIITLFNLSSHIH